MEIRDQPRKSRDVLRKNKRKKKYKNKKNIHERFKRLIASYLQFSVHMHTHYVPQYPASHDSLERERGGGGGGLDMLGAVLCI